ncbi:MAG: leucyl aminopeptidase, partial [Alphaproteobacteria bacterium]|nr:leucyl aminopeptidase [Alphaproteobacteria bacterium]
MTFNVTIKTVSFDEAGAQLRGSEDLEKPVTLVAFAGADLALAASVKPLLESAQTQIARAAKAAKFKGKAGSSLEILAPVGLAAARLVLIGVDTGSEETETKSSAKSPLEEFLNLGGKTAGRLPQAGAALVLFDFPNRPSDLSTVAAQFALGA